MKHNVFNSKNIKLIDESGIDSEVAKCMFVSLVIYSNITSKNDILSLIQKFLQLFELNKDLSFSDVCKYFDVFDYEAAKQIFLKTRKKFNL